MGDASLVIVAEGVQGLFPPHCPCEAPTVLCRIFLSWKDVRYTEEDRCGELRSRAVLLVTDHGGQYFLGETAAVETVAKQLGWPIAITAPDSIHVRERVHARFRQIPAICFGDRLHSR